MDRIIPHIESLLIQNDYAIVPELGGFTIRQQSAQIIGAEIIPPFSTVSFNVRMNSNDGLLATEVMRSENVNFREANKLIETAVEKIKNELYKGNKIFFGKLGYLYLNDEQQVAFRASKQTDFIPANFGLKTIYLPKQQVENEQRKITITLPKNRDVFRYAAAILVLVGIFLFSPKTGDSTVSNYAGWSNPLSTFNSIINAEEVEIEALTETLIVEEQVVDLHQPPKSYHIVVACLASRRGAERFRDSLLAKKFENAHILPSRTTNRIVIESFSDRATATAYMRNLRKTNREFRDAWLHFEKLSEQ